MRSEAAIRAVLRMQPDRPGVGRLAQEILSELTGEPIVLNPPPVLRLSLQGGGDGGRDRLKFDLENGKRVYRDQYHLYFNAVATFEGNMTILRKIMNIRSQKDDDKRRYYYVPQ